MLVLMSIVHPQSETAASIPNKVEGRYLAVDIQEQLLEAIGIICFRNTLNEQ